VGVTAASAEEEEVRRRSCVGVGARGRRREARRSEALAQRSAARCAAAASGAGLVSFSMADAASPLGVRAEGLGTRLLEGFGQQEQGLV